MVEEKARIVGSLNSALGMAGFEAKETWGPVIEDRGSQITFSALGHLAPIEEKIKWDPDFAKRKKIAAILTTLIPEFSVRMGGATSIDVTKQGIDKGYGIRKLRDTLGVAIDDMIFVGDAVFPGGNDYPAKEAGALSIRVRDPHESKRVIEAIMACLGSTHNTKTSAEAAPRVHSAYSAADDSHTFTEVTAVDTNVN